MIKIFGVGNTLLCDEGVGVKVIEKLQDRLIKLNDIINDNNKISVVIGETDYLFCLDSISDEDFIIIVDSTYFMIRPGTITVRSLNECDELISTDFVNDLSPHEESFIKTLRREKSNMQGYLIGIEIGRIDYSLELSKDLNNNFNNICENVYNDILKIISDYNNK